MWIAIKIVNAGGPVIVGGAAGPFESELDAEQWAENALIGGLGYEKYHFRELQAPYIPPVRKT